MEQHYKLFRVRELADGDEEFINVLAQTFLEEVPEDARMLKEVVENKNLAVAVIFAAMMIGISLIIGMAHG